MSLRICRNSSPIALRDELPKIFAYRVGRVRNDKVDWRNKGVSVHVLDGRIAYSLEVFQDQGSVQSTGRIEFCKQDKYVK